MAPQIEIWPSAQPVLETERLLLRPLVHTDSRTVQRQAGEFSIADTTLNVPHPYADGMAEEWIATLPAKFARQEAVTFAIILREDRSLIGIVSLEVTKRFCRAELGYWITKTLWNQGFATEAARAAVTYGFEQLGLHKIEATHLSRNPSSGRVMTKLGFKQEGMLREHVLKWGRFEDVVVYGLVCGTLSNAADH